MLQAYILEGEKEELRAHVWHPSLKLPDINEAGSAHDHRFDMTSCILLGRLTHVEINPSSSSQGEWNAYEVINARKALKETGTPAGEFRLAESTLGLSRRPIVMSAGSSYFFPKRCFHETITGSGLVITIAAKTNQEKSPARILCHAAREPLNAFRYPISDAQISAILADAEAALITDLSGISEATPHESPQDCSKTREIDFPCELDDLVRMFPLGSVTSSAGELWLGNLVKHFVSGTLSGRWLIG